MLTSTTLVVLVMGKLDWKTRDWDESMLRRRSNVKFKVEDTTLSLKDNLRTRLSKLRPNAMS